MKPIYVNQQYQQVSFLQGTVEGYTKNMHIKGAELKNIVTSSKDPITKDPHDVIKFDYTTSEIPEGESDWTLFFNITNTTIEQGDFDKLVLIIETEGGGNRVTQVYPINEGMGKIFKNITINTKLSPGININQTKIIFWSELQGKSITIENVMLVRGTYHRYIDYFDGTQGLGPEIDVISHNKNFASEIEEGNIDSSNGGLVGSNPGYNSARFKNYVEVLPNTNYTFSTSIKSIATGDFWNTIVFYDSNKKFISAEETKSLPSVSRTTPTNCYYVKCRVEGAFKLPNNLNDLKYQLELGTTPTKYVKPEYNVKTLLLPRDLRKDEVLIYDRDYNSLVIKDAQGRTSKLTNYFDCDIKTYDEKTWVSLMGVNKGKPENYLNASLSFDYLQDPEFTLIGRRHKRILIELTSGEVINTSLYKIIERSTDDEPIPDLEKGLIRFKEGFYNNANRIISVQEITRMIYLD